MKEDGSPLRTAARRDSDPSRRSSGLVSSHAADRDITGYVKISDVVLPIVDFIYSNFFNNLSLSPCFADLVCS